MYKCKNIFSPPPARVLAYSPAFLFFNYLVRLKGVPDAPSRISTLHPAPSETLTVGGVCVCAAALMTSKTLVVLLVVEMLGPGRRDQARPAGEGDGWLRYRRLGSTTFPLKRWLGASDVRWSSSPHITSCSPHIHIAGDRSDVTSGAWGLVSLLSARQRSVTSISSMGRRPQPMASSRVVLSTSTPVLMAANFCKARQCWHHG